jgi:hypothetical protein
MDQRRLSTSDVLAMGITNMPAPETDIPEDRDEVQYDVYEPITPKAMKDALEEGRVIYCPEYYGIPNIWKEGDIYRGTLLQYRSVTESPDFESADDAIVWFMETASAVAG